MKSILLIDDEIKLLHAYAVMLEKRGFNVFKASSGTEGINILLANKIDLIITDINMPEKNGLILVKQIKRMLKYKNVPIIILSGVGTRDNVFRGIEMGVFSFLTKPCNFSKLYETISRALNMSIESTLSSTAYAMTESDWSRLPSVLLVYRNAQVTDYIYEFLSERYYEVYCEGNPENVDRIIMEKGIRVLIVEVESLDDRYFDLLFSFFSKNRHTDIPTIVLSENAQELTVYFREMNFHVDKVLPRPFAYNGLVEEIAKVTDHQNIRKKLLFAIKKIAGDLKDLRSRETAMTENLRAEIQNLKNQNIDLMQRGMKNQNNNNVYLVFENNRKIDRLTKEISGIKKKCIYERAELLEAEKIVKLKLLKLTNPYIISE